VLLEFGDPRAHFIVNELACRLGDHALLFGEVFRGEDFFGRAFFDQEASAND
jgi:hypothetical protein